MASELDTSNSYRTVEIRLHQGRETLFGSLLVQVPPPPSWPASVTLPTGPQLYRLLISKHRFESYVDINDFRAWSFTWDESVEWRVEEFIHHGVMWRLEYRTRYPMPADPGEAALQAAAARIPTARPAFDGVNDSRD